ncbi:MAG TPA: hypothetical protein ENG16_03475, partial [Archaeoglobus sp.]|nr:hypothetical protein [Archaeoglobus sp.]
HSASTLTNEIPTIAFAGSCDTAKFVNTSHNYYTITEALGEASNFTGEICDQSDDKDWFGELFVKNPNGGAVVYIGSTVVVQDWCQDLNKYFFEKIKNAETIGDAWRKTLIEYADKEVKTLRVKQDGQTCNNQ